MKDFIQNNKNGINDYNEMINIQQPNQQSNQASSKIFVNSQSNIILTQYYNEDKLNRNCKDY